jgi:RHS repeat-associated protein
MQTDFGYDDALRFVHSYVFSASRYTGKERDSESGLDYFGARYYASSMGRWMSPDWADKPEAVPYSSLGDPQSLNLYAYARNSPIINIDADGHVAGPNDVAPLGSEEFGSGFNGSLTDYVHNLDGFTPQQKGKTTILGQSVPYTVAQMSPDASTAAVQTIQDTSEAINTAGPSLGQPQISEIHALTSIYVLASSNVNDSGGYSVTDRPTQLATQQNDHIKVRIGTFVLSANALSKVSAAYWGTAFVHEGTHIQHRDHGNPRAEHRAYHEQFKAAGAFHLSGVELAFVKLQCGSACN